MGGPRNFIHFFLGSAFSIVNHPMLAWGPPILRHARTVILAASVRKAEMFWALVVGLFDTCEMVI